MRLRAIILIIAALAVGAAINVAVAWGAAMYGSPVSAQPRVIRVYDQMSQIRIHLNSYWAPYGREVTITRGAGVTRITIIRSLVATIRDGVTTSKQQAVDKVIAAADEPDSDLRLHDLDWGPAWLDELDPGTRGQHEVTLAGWPFRSMCAWSHEDPGSIIPKRPPVSTPYATWRLTPEKRLPLKPMWPGFLANTVAYTSVPVLAAMLAPLRRRRRLRLNTCPRCAYPLGDAACPECGWRA